VLELPGCFASGAGMAELHQALTEAIGLYLSS
jgi:predicted RNase H-like HicB family nuclease